ncbi:MAG: histidine phosphatase family protein [Alphaproteobacteria bacterium]|nr:histidine phosphatase family protein [Alphaproteobacteria bacterium]
MRRLLLLRHAKASPDEPWVDDAQRPLTQKGRADAVRMGRFLRRHAPDQIYCSSALRTRQTLELLLPELEAPPGVEYRDELYLAKSSTIIEVIRAAPDVGSLMIVGHNPGLEECAHQLARRPSDRKMRKLYDAMNDKYPTGALAVMDFASPTWAGIDAQEGELDIFVRPKDLKEET